MSASTWPAASLEVAPAGLDGEEEAEDGDEVGLEERAGLDGDEDDGEDGDEEDGADEDADEDGEDEEPPAPGCLEWARDGVGRAQRGTDGLAVTAPKGWPAHGAALWAACAAGPMAPDTAPDAADPPVPAAAGAQEAGAGRLARVPAAVGAAGEFLLTR
jgi:hypothetical protein